MSDPNDENSARPRPAVRNDFTATHWTLVAQAAEQDDSAPARQALEALCGRYWPAIYSFLRRKNHSPEDAADLTQSFFSHLLADKSIARADRSKGRFRNFLLDALQRFLVDEHGRKGTQKRGLGQAILTLSSVEETYLEEADPGLTPERLFDRRWAATVLESAFADLQTEFREADQLARFEALKKYLSEEVSDGDYDGLGTRLGLAPKAVAGAEEVDAEFRELFR